MRENKNVLLAMNSAVDRDEVGRWLTQGCNQVIKATSPLLAALAIDTSPRFDAVIAEYQFGDNRGDGTTVLAAAVRKYGVEAVPLFMVGEIDQITARQISTFHVHLVTSIAELRKILQENHLV